MRARRILRTELIRQLAQKVTPQVADPEAQKMYSEQAEETMLACYTLGKACGSVFRARLRKRFNSQL
jgi:hypothetical protein